MGLRGLTRTLAIAVASWSVFASPLMAAPIQQAECVTDALDAPKFKALVRAFFSQKLERKAQDAKARKAIAPDLNRCAKKHGWSELDVENAYIYTEMHTMERIMFFLLEAGKIDPVKVNRVYKEEPLSRVKMILALDDDAYRKSLIARFAKAGIATDKKDANRLLIAYIAMRLLSDQSFNDFHNGRKYGEELEDAASEQEVEADKTRGEAGKRFEDAKCITGKVPTSTLAAFTQSQFKREANVPENYSVAFELAAQSCQADHSWNELRTIAAMEIAILQLAIESSRGVVTLEGIDADVVDRWWDQQDDMFKQSFGEKWTAESEMDGYLAKMSEAFLQRHSPSSAKEQNQLSAIAGYYQMKTELRRVTRGLPLE